MDEKKITSDLKDIEENKVVAAIAYIWILCFIPLLLKRESKFAQFHGKQGLVLFIIDIVAAFLVWIPVLGWILMFVLIVASIIGILQALAGRWYRMPIIAQLADKINL